MKTDHLVTNAADRLVEIDRNDLENLKNLYNLMEKKNNSIVAYRTISNYIRWFEQNPKLTNQIKFYTLNGDFSDGTFVVIHDHTVLLDTLNESFDRLHRLLLLIDYTKCYVFIEFRPELRSTIKHIFETVNVEITLDLFGSLYYLAKEEALKFDVQAPDGIELRPICKPDDIEKVISLYPYPRPNFRNFLQQMAEYNPNVGAFTTDGTLIAWIFCYPCGLLGTLQTDEMYQGKGYAKLLVKHLSRKMAEMGHDDVYTAITNENKTSQSLFAKIGFKPISPIQWIRSEKQS